MKWCFALFDASGLHICSRHNRYVAYGKLICITRSAFDRPPVRVSVIHKGRGGFCRFQLSLTAWLNRENMTAARGFNRELVIEREESIANV